MKSEEKNLFDRIKTMKKAGLAGKQLIPGANLFPCDAKNHLKAVLHFLQNIKQIKIDEMYCFIMYDIESNRVRNYISKYLIRKGCMRVQKSVFVACLKKENYQKIYTTLKEVSEIYENDDSILILPISEDHLNGLKVIGQNIDFELMINPPNTLII